MSKEAYPPKVIITPEIVMLQCTGVAATVTPLVPLHDYPQLGTYIHRAQLNCTQLNHAQSHHAQ